MYRRRTSLVSAGYGAEWTLLSCVLRRCLGHFSLDYIYAVYFRSFLDRISPTSNGNQGQTHVVLLECCKGHKCGICLFGIANWSREVRSVEAEQLRHVMLDLLLLLAFEVQSRDNFRLTVVENLDQSMLSLLGCTFNQRKVSFYILLPHFFAIPTSCFESCRE